MTLRYATEAEQAAAVEPYRQLKAAYQTCFGAHGAETVREHIAEFCYAYRTCWDADPRIHAMKEGRRSVWLLMQLFLTKTPEELAIFFRAKVPDDVEEKKEEA